MGLSKMKRTPVYYEYCYKATFDEILNDVLKEKIHMNYPVEERRKIIEKRVHD